MSKIGNHRVGLQENPCYEDGWNGFLKGLPRDYADSDQPFYADDEAAWRLGWDDAQADRLAGMTPTTPTGES